MWLRNTKTALYLFWHPEIARQSTRARLKCIALWYCWGSCSSFRVLWLTCEMMSEITAKDFNLVVGTKDRFIWIIRIQPFPFFCYAWSHVHYLILTLLWVTPKMQPGVKISLYHLAASIGSGVNVEPVSPALHFNCSFPVCKGKTKTEWLILSLHGGIF